MNSLNALLHEFCPSGVEHKPLGKCCTIIGGGTPSKATPEFYAGSIPWATVRDMNTLVIHDTEYHITEEAIAKSASNLIPAGSLVISTHVGVGKACILANDTAINQDLKAVIPQPELLTRYLFHWFLDKSDFLVSKALGSTVKGLSLDFVKSLSIPLPPLPVQEEIVRRLDAMQEVVEALEAELALRRKQYEVVRKSLFANLEASQ